MSADRVSLRFELSKKEAGGLPVAFESLWCRHEEHGYLVSNSPFFVSGIAFGDVIAVAPTLDESAVRLTAVINSSGNSTIWVNIAESANASAMLEKLRHVGCLVEGGVFPSYYSICVLAGTSIEPVLALLDEFEDSGAIEVNYPCLRHDVDA